MTSKIVYVGGLRSEATHLQSGDVIRTDAPRDNYGKGEAFSPTDLLATSLGCCMISIMGIVALKNNFVFEGGSVEITKIMEASPRRVGEVIVNLLMPKLNFTDEQKKMLETAALNCPVAKSLHPDLKQTVSFTW
jgi:putative redox protein